jgi:hypothetical protein
MRKMIPFLSAVAIMAVLSLRQRLFLVQSDTGRQWAVMAMWFGLCDWFLRSPKTRVVPAHQPAATTAPLLRAARLGDARNQEAGNPSQFGDSEPVVDHLYIPIGIGPSRTDHPI